MESLLLDFVMGYSIVTLIHYNWIFHGIFHWILTFFPSCFRDALSWFSEFWLNKKKFKTKPDLNFLGIQQKNN